MFSVFVCMYVCILYVFMIYNGCPIMEDNKESINQFLSGLNLAS